MWPGQGVQEDPLAEGEHDRPDTSGIWAWRVRGCKSGESQAGDEAGPAAVRAARVGGSGTKRSTILGNQLLLPAQFLIGTGDESRSGAASWEKMLVYLLAQFLGFERMDDE